MKYKKGDFVFIKDLCDIDILPTDPHYEYYKEFCGKFGGTVKMVQGVAATGYPLIMGRQIRESCIRFANHEEVKETPSSFINTSIINSSEGQPIAEVKEFLAPENEGPLDETLMKSALRFNEGKPKWTLVHFNSLVPLVRVLEYGAKKYAPYNWQNPMSRMDILDSMQRHMAKLIDGEENDEESGLPHVGHILANAMFYSFHVTTKK